MKIQIQFFLMILISLLLQAQAQEITERSIKEILNSDGTIRKGVEGSFNAQGYQMHYGKNGEPIFLPKPQDITEGTWNPLGTGSNNGVSGGSSSFVSALAISGTDLFIGGNFTQAGGVSANSVVRYNLLTNTWHSLGTGSANGVNGQVLALAVVGDNLFIGGGFVQAGGIEANRVVRYNLITNTWHSLGTGSNNGLNGNVLTIAVKEDNVFVGGEFNQAGGQSANFIARYNLTTDTWNSFGSGSSNGVNGIVRVVVVSGNNLFVGGDFTQAGGSTARRVVRYDLTTYTRWNLGSGSANGVNDFVYAIAVSDDNVFVGGSFLRAGGIDAMRIARYNLTTNTWHSLGTGSTNGLGGGIGGIYADVKTIAVSGNNVLVGGLFTLAGGQTANRVARFDLITNTWHSLGTGNNNGLNDRVNSLVVAADNVFVGGAFTQAGEQLANYVARYTESLTSVEEDEVFINSYILHQNYPNPFNPSTTISFSIPESEFVTLKVYDVLGNEVETLVNETLSAGNHSYNFDASNLTSGVYFYKLQAGSFYQVKKMILTK